jgi:uncharacterized ubiquitin-like protein YukD
MFIYSLLLVLVYLISVQCIAPISVTANVRGKKYEIVAENVEQFTKKVEELTGIESTQQNILFKGKVLSTADKFESLGITKGDVLNVVKGRKPSASVPSPAVAKPVKTPDEVKASLTPNPSNTPAATSQSSSSSLPATASSNPLDMPNFSEEDYKKAQETMNGLLDSNFIEEFFSDEEKLEKSRVALLQNLDKYETMMPGFKQQAEEIASDPVKWKEAMMSAREQMVKLKEKRNNLKGSGAPSTPSPPK